MSAKDIAFDKERTKFRQTIRNLESEIKEKKKNINELKSIVAEKDDIIRQKDDWIQRLLSFTELSEDEMKSMVETEEAKKKLVDGLSPLFKIMGSI